MFVNIAGSIPRIETVIRRVTRIRPEPSAEGIRETRGQVSWRRTHSFTHHG